jgi:nucleotide-binding universal stress UspA family protein
MIDGSTRHIICAVRGQPESRATVTRAIDLALENEARLTFCLVIGAEFLAKSAPTLTPLRAAYQQLEDMGEFSMLILCDRAQRRGVEQVDYLIRKGNIPEQLHLLACETGADVMVLGRPVRGIGRSVFTPAEFDSFVESLEQDIGIQIVQVVRKNMK